MKEHTVNIQQEHSGYIRHTALVHIDSVVHGCDIGIIGLL